MRFINVIIIKSMEVAAVGGKIDPTFHNPYFAHVIEKATVLVNGS
jgi:hypothetical protein